MTTHNEIARRRANRQFSILRFVVRFVRETGYGTTREWVALNLGMSYETLVHDILYMIDCGLLVQDVVREGSATMRYIWPRGAMEREA